MEIRNARLDDTDAISMLARQQISVWQRLDAGGNVTNVAYDDLSIYERWLHGGAWMSIETGAVHLNHLIGGGGVAAVMVEQGTITGYAEAYPGSEPPPFGHHLHLAMLMAADDRVRDALLRHLRDYTRTQGFQRLTVSFSSYDAESAVFYGHYGMSRIAQTQRYTLTARTGQGFYKIQEQSDASPAQIEGWYMTAGRLQSAQYHWQTLWPALWCSIPEIAARPAFRLRLNASGHEALAYIQQQLYVPRSVDVFCWSPKPMSPQLLTALRDWVHRQNYRTLVLDIPDDMAKILGADAEISPYQQVVYGVNVL